MPQSYTNFHFKSMPQPGPLSIATDNYYDLAVRRSQEALELCLKSLLILLQRNYPAAHDLKELLTGFQITLQRVARLVLGNAVLGLWRLPAFYGDERLKVANLFNSKEAELAASYAELGEPVCNVVRSELYRRATTG